MRRCICFKGSLEEPPDTDPRCPQHGYDEDTGEPHEVDDDDYFDEPDDFEDFDDPHGEWVDRRFWNYPY